MKIIVVGMGVIGGAVARLLDEENEVRSVSRSSAPLRVDAKSLPSINEFYEEAGAFDALIVAIGIGRVYTPFWELAPEDYDFAFQDRVMTQINLVRLGVNRINDGGVFVLSSGFLNKTPIPGFSAITASNGAIDGFIAGAAQDMPRGIRINGVSATFVQETMEARGMTQFGGLEVIPAAITARAYRAALASSLSGCDLHAKDYV